MPILPLLLFAMGPLVLPSPADHPFRQPQMVVQGHDVFLTFGGPNEIYFARSSDDGHSFPRPVRIASVPKMDLGRHRGPRIALAGKALVVTAVIKDEAAGLPGDLVAWRSTDNGTHWSEPVRVNDVRMAANEGLHDLASDGKNLLFATWLDHRALQAKQPGVGPQLYGAVSKDGGRTWSKNVLVYKSPSGSICSCCHPNAVAESSGALYVMFRNDVEGSRDEYLIESQDGGRSFGAARKLGSGTWPLNACPMDGGGLAVEGNEFVSVWRRDKTIYTASGSSGEHEIGPGKDADIALTRDGRFLIWTSPEGLVVSGPDARKPALLDAQGGFGQLRRLDDDRVVAAWESPKGIEVQVLDRATIAKLPAAGVVAQAR
jgi:hypothetical protein